MSIIAVGMINTYQIYNTTLLQRYLNLRTIPQTPLDNRISLADVGTNATRIEVISSTSEIIWGEYLFFSINFTYTEDKGTTWQPIISPDAYCNISIMDLGYSEVLFKKNLINNEDGTFNITINSSRFSARWYLVIITGNYSNYTSPNELYLNIKINALETGLTVHDYTTLTELLEPSYSEFYNELINITVRYYDVETNTSLSNALITYEWHAVNPSPIEIQPDPINDGYFTFTINTSDALSIGLYHIDISAQLENYSSIEDYEILLSIYPRLTRINDQDHLSINQEIWIGESTFFTFNYSDENTREIIGDLDIAYYEWNELDNDGYFTNNSGNGTLIQNPNKTYTLNFKTYMRDAGVYSICVYMEKNNYLLRFAEIIFIISLKLFNVNGTTSDFNITKSILNGTHLDFFFEINDNLTGEGLSLDSVYYYWYKIADNGTIIEGPNINISLFNISNNVYNLDFQTEFTDVGNYQIYVVFQKTNYSSIYVVINLIIYKNTTAANTDISGFNIILIIGLIGTISIYFIKKKKGNKKLDF